MSGIVLSASVRQNLLSLQSTAALLATTQNDLSTGTRSTPPSTTRPTTSPRRAQQPRQRHHQSARRIGNGVQVLQAANTGITSLQSLIATAQSIANQVLQTPVGYSTKSNVNSPPSPARPPTTCSATHGDTDATHGRHRDQHDHGGHHQRRRRAAPVRSRRHFVHEHRGRRRCRSVPPAPNRAGTAMTDGPDCSSTARR